MLKISRRAQKIKSFLAMDILEAAQKMQRAGEDVISFSIGEPDFDPPACVKEATIRAVTDNITKYTESQGMLSLREAICEHYFSKYQVRIGPEQVIVTQGTSPAFFLVFSLLLNLEDEVILPNPHYPCDANFVEFLGGKPVYVPVLEKENYQWDVEKIRKKLSKKTKAVFVTSPSNPTGAVLTKDVLQKIGNLKIPVVSDEIYHGLVYEGREHSMLEFTQNTFVINGFSKAYAMTGFRLGYVIAPKHYVSALRKIQQNFYISANSFVQEAGIAALKYGAKDLEKMRLEFKERRSLMLDGLKRIGFKVNYDSAGAFYFFVKCGFLSKNSLKLAYDILKKAKVAVTPGIDFGRRGEGHLRFSYATSRSNIIEGLNRIECYIQKFS